MATLEQITRGAAVRGILPEGLVTIRDVRWIGTVAIEITYKDSAGRLGNELLYRDCELTPRSRRGWASCASESSSQFATVRE